MSSSRDWSSAPESTAPCVEDQTNGQLTMNDPRSPWNLVSDAGSSSLGSPGPPTPDVPISPMMRAASVPASDSSPSWISSAGASGLSSTWPPPPSTSALIHTVSDSAFAPCTASSASWSCAASMIWSHVTGPLMSSPAASATDLRYQRSWVFAQNGIATSSSFHVEAAGELLALGRGVARQELGLDAVGAVGGLRALRRDLRLAAVVRVDVPREGGRPVVARPARGERCEHRQRGERGER